MNRHAAARRHFVEAVGLAASSDGFTRIGGRLFGLLILAGEPRSLDDLARTLGVSKASVSTDARRLIESGVVERVGMPADRRTWYQIAPDFFVRLIARRVARWTHFARLVADLRRDDPRPGPHVAARLRAVEDIHARVVERIARTLARTSAPHRGARAARRV